MCPIVPIFTCGLLRSNFSFAMVLLQLVMNFRPRRNWSCWPGLNWRPRPYQGRSSQQHTLGVNGNKGLAESWLGTGLQQGSTWLQTGLLQYQAKGESYYYY